MNGRPRTRVAPRPLRLPVGLVFMVPSLLLTFALYLLPLARLATLSFGEQRLSLRSYTQLFDCWSYGTILFHTLMLSTSVTVGCIILGYPVAYLLAFAPPRARSLIALTVLLPFWTSALVRNFAWIYLLRDGGFFSIAAGILIGFGHSVQLLYTQTGIVIAMANMLLPLMVYPIFVSIDMQDRDLWEVAQSLGANPARVIQSVTLPLSRAGIFAGSLLVFSTSMGFFITPALLGGGRTLVAATFIDRQIESFLDWPLAAAASVILLLISATVALLGLRVASAEAFRGNHAST